jgi:hypothetical protein
MTNRMVFICWRAAQGAKVSTATVIFAKENKLVCISLYYKHVTIVYYASSGVKKLKASLNDGARVIIYDRDVFKVQATDNLLLQI